MADDHAGPIWELGPAEEWVLKGEGNANVVYGYIGSRAHLVGKVLKVRKGTSRSASEASQEQQQRRQLLEDIVWSPMLGQHSSPMARELLYVQRCLVPLLGADHVPEQVPIPVPRNFLRQLSSVSAADESRGVGGCTPAALQLTSSPAAVLMSDATLLPEAAYLDTSSIPAYSSSGAMADVTAAGHGRPAGSSSGCESSRRGAAEGGPGPGGVAACGKDLALSPVGPLPALCVEIKPKCGYLAACPTLHPDNRIKHSKSCYQLHQILKVADGKVAGPSSYDPLDLFSGEPQRMLRALRALFAHPQNNLRMFWGGRPVGLQEGLRMWADAVTARGSQGPELGRTDGGVGQAAAAVAADGGCGTEAGTLEELLPILVQILVVDGVLDQMLEAQRQCEYDIECVHALYCQLLANVGGQAAASSTAGPGSPPQQQQQQGEGEQLSVHGPGCDDSPTAPASSHGAVQRLLSLPLDEAYAMLRRYVVAATAKDCALMATLRRLGSASEAQRLQQLGCKVARHPQLYAWEGEKQGLVGATPRQPGGGAASGEGAWYQYRVTFVDLDMKPLAKIPKHFALHQRIVQAAQQQDTAAREEQAA